MADKTLNQIRTTFLDYFEKNDHKIVDSSNLVPNNDPTLMFANSGIPTLIQWHLYSKLALSLLCRVSVEFKRYF